MKTFSVAVIASSASLKLRSFSGSKDGELRFRDDDFSEIRNADKTFFLEEGELLAIPLLVIDNESVRSALCARTCFLQIGVEERFIFDV